MKFENKKVERQGLLRVIDVLVKAEEINREVEKRLLSLKQRVKIKGFRAGKVPMSTIRDMYQNDSVREVASEAVKQTSRQVIAEEGGNPALSPEITDTKFNDQGDLSYRIRMEMMPELDVFDLGKLHIKHAEAKVSDAAVAKEIKQLLTLVPRFCPPEKERASREGDLLVVALKIFHNRKLLKDEAKVEIVLGSGRLPRVVEEQLVGKHNGDTVDQVIKIPARKKVPAGSNQFIVTIKEIKERLQQKDQQTLIESLNFKDEPELQKFARQRVENRYQTITNENDHRQFLKFLADSPDFPLPEKLVKAEIDNLIEQLGLEEKAKAVNDYYDIAAKRVKLGILVANLARQQKVAVSEKEASEYLQAEAMKYGDRAIDFLELVNQDVFTRNRMLAPLIEQKVFEVAKKMATTSVSNLSETEISQLATTLEEDIKAEFDVSQSAKRGKTSSKADKTKASDSKKDDAAKKASKPKTAKPKPRSAATRVKSSKKTTAKNDNKLTNNK